MDPSHKRFRKWFCSIFKGLFNYRVVIPFLLLITIFSIDHFFVRTIFNELDIAEHFIFGFIISEATSLIVASTDINEQIKRKINNENVRQLDLFLRLLGFLIIGGLLWESLEYYLFPIFGIPPNPFFSFPITLRNIDGTVDVIIGILGCILAWYTANVYLDKC
ncbi:MAG: hypothetical protein JSV51_07470 [Candidatus Bathyarchaeota archaeon]|nr:MAG: hypothetical protein JSV51_07470 [Candidatus Bathyarchaeota archaeon]